MKPEWLDVFSLDDEEGPATPLAAQDAEALASKAVARALPSGGASSALRSPRTLFIAASLGGALALFGAVHGFSSNEAPCLGGPCAGEPATSHPAAMATVTPPDETVASEQPASQVPALEAVPISSLPDAVLDVPPPASAPRGQPTVVETRAASDLLAEANRARGDRDWARAASLYERVMRSRADEAYAATVALASLRVDHLGDPRGALELYERALADRPDGALSAQSKAGAARCRQILSGEEPARP